MKRLSTFLAALFAFAWSVVRAQELPSFDFTSASAWGQPHDLELLPVTSEGLTLRITGGDPYFFGPARDYPTGQNLWLNMRVRSETGGNAQVFFFQDGPSEGKSVRFYIPGGDWTNVRVPFPAFGPGMRLRFDPPGTSGLCVLGRIWFEPRSIPATPDWPKPGEPRITRNARSVRSGDLELKHGQSWGDFELRLAGERIAIGNNRPLAGYTRDGRTTWFEATNRVNVRRVRNAIVASASAKDPDGATWRLEQSFRPSTRAGGIEIESSVEVTTDRAVVWMPMFTLLPGVGSFGTNKTQGLFAGVEYLENEPSSSEADVRGPGARRQVPDFLKITFPLMAISTTDRWLGLIWEQQPHFAALHDSPDRIFNSGGHAMAIVFPGSDPAQREDGSILPYGGEKLAANQKLTLRATIIGGLGNTVIPAVQEFVARRGLPSPPNPGYAKEQYFALTASGWLDSAIRLPENRFRHAVGNNFGGAAVADAPLYMEWLATRSAAHASRLREHGRAALAQVARENYVRAGVGHIRHPDAPLIFGGIAESVAAAEQDARGLLSSFEPDGSVRYRGGHAADLGKTHWTNEANGLTGTRVATVLERAAFSGNRELIARALRMLDAMEKFRDTVPRGAQTWEVPLHTPDILGSAYMVRAYTVGYELTGDAKYFEQAKYWAWTGVPFIYLTAPTPGPVGLYGTIPVLGATHYVAPLWIGLPVQWCGLVYGDAIRRFARHDPSGPWITLANGIAASGIQQTHTAREPDYQGLLPDSYDLRAQVCNPVPINPGTLQPEAIQFYGEDTMYGFRALRRSGLLVHAPGPISEVKDVEKSASFKVRAWPAVDWRILIHGLRERPRLKINGESAEIGSRHEFDDAGGSLILTLNGESKIELTID